MIETLCTKYTNLTSSEINKIKDVSKSLQLMADFYEADIFIDVLSKEDDSAVVIDHAVPKDKKSLYENSVIEKKALKENEPGTLKSLETGEINKDIKALTQENKIVKQRIHPINFEGKVVGVLVVEKDISNQIEDDFKLEIKLPTKDSKSEDFLGLLKDGLLISNNLHDGILIFDSEGKLFIKNNKADSIYKNLGNRMINYGEHFNDVSLVGLNFEDIKNMARAGYYEDKKIEMKIENFYFEIDRIIVNKDDSFKIIEVIKDVTDIKNKETELVLKSVSIREAHHRVKNSLQTVASLLRSQSRRCENKEAKSYLEESVNRILAISTTHDLLSKLEYKNIKVRNALECLVENMKRSFSGLNVNIYITGNNFCLENDKVMALLLVVNEIIQNSLDHAFKDKNEGNIQILINKGSEENVIAIVDDGCGFDVNSIKNSRSLGMAIINSYIKDKLKGSIKIESNELGTKVILKFK